MLIRNKKLESENSALTSAILKAVSASGAPNPLLIQMENELRAKGKVENVQKTYDKVLGLDPDNLEAIEGKLQCLAAQINIKNRERSEAIPKVVEEFRTFLTRHQDKVHSFTPKGKLALAVACDGLHEFKLSHDLYRSVHGHFHIKQTYAISLLMSGKVEQAYEAIHLAMATEPINPAMLFNLGEIEHAMGHFELAISAHQKVGNFLANRYSYKRIAESKYYQMEFFSAFIWNVKFIILGNSTKEDYLNCLIFFKILVFQSPVILISRFIKFLPFVNIIYSKLLNPSRTHLDILGYQLNSFPDCYSNAANIAKEAFGIEKNLVNLFNYVNLLTKNGNKCDAIVLINSEILYAEGKAKEFMEDCLRDIESKSVEDLKARKVNTQVLD